MLENNPVNSTNKDAPALPSLDFYFAHAALEERLLLGHHFAARGNGFD